MASSTILVTGATDDVGSFVLPLLDRRRHRVRALVRRRPARPVAGVDYREGDPGDPAFVDGALAGAEAVFLACADHLGQESSEGHLVDRAARAGVGHLVLLSTFGAAPDAPVACWRRHGQLEEHLAGSGLPHTVLRPYVRMSALLPALDRARATGVLPAPAGTAQVALVDPRDVAAVAARLLTGGPGPQRVLTLTGPEALDHDQVAGALSRALEWPVSYQDVDEAAARAELLGSGLPAPEAEQVLAVYSFLRAGMQSRVQDSVWRLTGRNARALDDYLRAVVPLPVPAKVPALPLRP